MNAAFAARLPFEVFDGVSDVYAFAVDAGFFQCPVQNAAGRSDERLAEAIFIVSRLFADEDHLGFVRARAENRLRAALVEITAATTCSGGGEFG